MIAEKQKQTWNIDDTFFDRLDEIFIWFFIINSLTSEFQFSSFFGDFHIHV